eukprot:CAMPEP_0197715986 /NCGR_PEP_ID=MMETSP1434-20131217/1031_1 /TAXON_ID=265543 /ORGANISM="Minutocellus polymorphus, Strain CCMP3303" /LENGTH=196 /DNA_ID=CAMNT_0043300261 /DNA_START=197 /DNA_END=788 /DNA_ORIENTATION=-
MRIWASILLIAASNARCCADAFALDPGVACTRAKRKKTVRISKPLGIIVEEVDANDPSKGVCVGSIVEGGNAASCGTDACIHDAIVAVNGADCVAKSFQEVMDLIVSCKTPEVELTLARMEGRVAVRWPNGVCVAAPVGEYLGNVASEADFVCRTRADRVAVEAASKLQSSTKKKEKKLRPCGAKVPKGVEIIEFF